MRKKPLQAENSEEALSANRLLKSLSELQMRLDRLEKEVFPCGSDDLTQSPPPKPRMGRKPTLTTEILLKRRMFLVAWIKRNWPCLTLAIQKAEKSGDCSGAIASLVAAKQNGIIGELPPPLFAAPEKFAVQLAGFLASGRFTATREIWLRQWLNCLN